MSLNEPKSSQDGPPRGEVFPQDSFPAVSVEIGDISAMVPISIITAAFSALA